MKYLVSPGNQNHTFENVSCFQKCELVVIKHSSHFGANSNSTITKCERTPKLGKQAVYYLYIILLSHMVS